MLTRVFLSSRHPTRSITKPLVENFTREFIKTYIGHGGKVDNRSPALIQLPADAGKGVELAFNQATAAFGKRPQILVFVLADKNGFHYFRVKKSCDCRFGVVSQCEPSSLPVRKMI